ncbi:MAG: hypothetical protein IIB18_00775 [Chloroflexi bacterium]|nr:hypothetical protein [Chloroflexota bacterium]
MSEFTRNRRGGDPLALGSEVSRLDRVHILAVVLALGMVAYLAIEPTQNWLLLLLAGLAAIATDSVVRNHPRADFHGVDATALYLFVPVLFTLGLGLFLEDVVGGYETVAIGLLSVIPFWAILRAEYESVDRLAPSYQSTRLVLNIATYVTAFLFYATIYDFDLSLVTASFAAGVVSVLLAIEILREKGLDTTRTILYAVAIGGIIAEAAWATHFLPLEESSAAVLLLLTFYLTTGLMHNYLGSKLNPRTAAEFAGVGALGVVIIAISHVAN